MVWAEKRTPDLPNELQGQADVLHVTHSHRFKKLHYHCKKYINPSEPLEINI